MSAVGTSELQAELRRLERQVDRLKARLVPPRESLPEHPFEALELRVGDSWFAAEVGSLREVIPMIWCEPIPEAPAWVLGLAQIGDESFPVVELGRRIGLDDRDLHPDRRIVLADTERGAAGFVVDELGAVRRYEPGEIDPIDAELPHASFVLGAIGSTERRPLLLSIDRIARELATDE